MVIMKCFGKETPGYMGLIFFALLFILGIAIVSCLPTDQDRLMMGQTIEYYNNESGYNISESSTVLNLKSDGNDYVYLQDLGGYFEQNRSSASVTKIIPSNQNTITVNKTFWYHTPERKKVIVPCFTGPSFQFDCSNRDFATNYCCTITGGEPTVTLTSAEFIVPKNYIVDARL
jgi:hypothetical protein